MGFEIGRVVRPEDLAACYAVRLKVFVDEQKVPPEEELDADDERAEHFLVREEGRIVATARLLDKGGGVGKIGRVAVLAESRGQGVGRALMLYVMEQAGARFRMLMLDAQLQVIPFYERLGFAAEGEVFMDAGIPHRRMWRPA